MRFEKNIFVKDLTEGREVNIPLLVVSSSQGLTKTGNPYLTLKLMDSSGTLTGKVWDDVEGIKARIVPGKVAAFRGQTSVYRGELQFTVKKAFPLDDSECDPDDYRNRSARPQAAMRGELLDILSGLPDPDYRAFALAALEHPGAAGFWTAPAAKYFHHAYAGGLLEHTLSVARLADFAGRHYGGLLNRSLLVAGAALHDIGKVWEFTEGPDTDYTTRGRLLGHLVIGPLFLAEVARGLPGFPETKLLLLQHLLVSHHGAPDMGSTVTPKLLEGFALHFLDNLDGKIAGVAGILAREVRPDSAWPSSEWTTYNRQLESHFMATPRSPEEDRETAGEGPAQAQGGPAEPSGRAAPGGPGPLRTRADASLGFGSVPSGRAPDPSGTAPGPSGRASDPSGTASPPAGTASPPPGRGHPPARPAAPAGGNGPPASFGLSATLRIPAGKPVGAPPGRGPASRPDPWDLAPADAPGAPEADPDTFPDGGGPLPPPEDALPPDPDPFRDNADVPEPPPEPDWEPGPPPPAPGPLPGRERADPWDAIPEEFDYEALPAEDTGADPDGTEGPANLGEPVAEYRLDRSGGGDSTSAKDGQDPPGGRPASGEVIQGPGGPPDPGAASGPGFESFPVPGGEVSIVSGAPPEDGGLPGRGFPSPQGASGGTGVEDPGDPPAESISEYRLPAGAVAPPREGATPPEAAGVAPRPPEAWPQAGDAGSREEPPEKGSHNLSDSPGLTGSASHPVREGDAGSAGPPGPEDDAGPGVPPGPGDDAGPGVLPGPGDDAGPAVPPGLEGGAGPGALSGLEGGSGPLQDLEMETGPGIASGLPSSDVPGPPSVREGSGGAIADVSAGTAQEDGGTRLNWSPPEAASQDHCPAFPSSGPGPASSGGPEPASSSIPGPASPGVPGEASSGGHEPASPSPLTDTSPAPASESSPARWPVPETGEDADPGPSLPRPRGLF
ncbi:MAG: HD domain-containing protein [Deltaproteobacteria bacterium]|jgi:3'-5' exoribonuclease|nr:HD domain-containing protein [Deltaproteobacteria bacterium]